MPTRNVVEVSVEVQKLMTSLRKLGDNEIRKQIRLAGKDAADVIADRAKQLVPVGTTAKRGQRLKQTIKPYATNTRVGVKAGNKKNFHAKFVEFGHKKRGSKRGQGHGWVKEQPFMHKAAEETLNKFMTKYTARLDQVIQRFNKGKI